MARRYTAPRYTVRRYTVQLGMAPLGMVDGMAASFHITALRFSIIVATSDRSSDSMPAATRHVGLGSRQRLAGGVFGFVARTVTATTE